MNLIFITSYLFILQHIPFAMAVFVGGLVGMILFYLVILVVGLLSARKSSTNAEDAMLGGRKFGIILGSLTLTGFNLYSISLLSATLHVHGKHYDVHSTPVQQIPSVTVHD